MTNSNIDYIIDQICNFNDKNSCVILNDIVKYINCHGLYFIDVLNELHKFVLNKLDKFDENEIVDIVETMAIIDTNVSFGGNVVVNIANLLFLNKYFKKLF
jgi:hypothetical protein